ncbi:D-glycerate 2-kinase [Caenispirillum salinarum AK4]|uniref:D-glycerate 2-kinase n=1 Tax=Caenispirillum salinarum AK4 TaxID=1238182 RepID=K9H3S3_9PROT|nr:glycerate kinase [Caenispirillum salinarum]EKV32925.1 D-glycerate 2-kinase [Caenispirillum salinarum AK4]
MDDVPAFLRRLFDAAVAAADPAKIVPPALPEPPTGRTIVVGAGKASAAMARAVDRAWPRDAELSGCVVTRYGHGCDAGRIEIVEAAHPVPDEAGWQAAQQILDLVREAGPDDLILCLISGGGSALLSLPAGDIPREDKQELTKALLKSGAAIDEINCVRKHISAVKGGRLAQAAGSARMLALAISDVAGDDPSVIASGPTVPDPSTREEAKAVLERYGIKPPESIATWLDSDESETPKPGDDSFANVETRVIGRPLASLKAAAEVAEREGVAPLILGDIIEGEAQDVAKVMAAMAVSCRDHGLPAGAPCVLLSGGELTVTHDGGGRGGPNAEFVLGMARELAGQAGLWALACDTDGIDGSEDNAGAWCGPDTAARAQRSGAGLGKALDEHDSYGFFKAVDGLVMSGPTLTNVNDFRAVFVESGD